MRHLVTVLMVMVGCLTVCGQAKREQSDNLVSFDDIIHYFEKHSMYLDDTISLPLIHANKNYKIEISDTPVYFEIKEIVIKNPFDDKYPISFSVIYQDKLVSLFEQGKFVCHKIPSMERDIKFEKILNTKKFEYHWIIDGKLVGRIRNGYYFLNSEGEWIKYKDFMPLKNQPKLFEDSDYICFFDCHGEWGGTVYFYKKSTQKIYFTEATCANSIQKKDNKYLVLSHLGHMMGSTELKSITSPESLSIVDTSNINKTHKGEALGYIDKSAQSKIIFDYFGVQIFSSFVYQNKTIYMVHWNERTFFAEIEDDTIKIINPLFNNELYTHDPITVMYNDIVLMNLDFYGIAREREVSCIIIKDKQLIKVDWNENHSR